MNRSILLATLVLATACMTGPHDGQIWSGGSSLSFNGYLERPNEEVQLVALNRDGAWARVATPTIRSVGTATRWDEANWYAWSVTVPSANLTPYWRNEGTTGRRIHLKAQTRRSSTVPWTDLYSFRESILSTTSQCSVHTPGRTVSDLEPCMSTVSPVVRIRDSAFTTCTSDSSCNGRDEDCDGRFDESYVGGSTSCGVGACRATGTRSCSSGTVNNSCVPRPATGDDTDCDAIDDDCDGRTDEHFVVTQVSCGSGVGVCAQPGTRRCVSGSITTTCEPGGTASDETCNGLDDDCDGSTDESHSACGTDQCVAETACGAGGVPQCRPKKRDDTCDGFDDDCDGEIDEHHGTIDATCDGVDDDCDGRFDENFVDLNPCATETCSGGVLTSTPTPGACPSDPLGSGPPTLPGTSTPFAESLEGLLGDYQTVPSGTAPEAIVPERATRLYGEVHTLTGGPMGGVRVSVLDHPGLGSVLTRADGRFDLVVNGGNVLSVVFERAGHPTVHRTIRTGWNEHVWVPDVVMTPLDTPTSIAGLGSGTSALQIHRGSAVNDGDGLGIERRATLLIPRETRGTYTRADGSSAPLPATSTLRATEFTVGALGPDAMPATLPSQIMYTYALELSIDEADADGAEQVQFDRVLPFYVENFLGFPTGTAVPTGWYDRVAARWRPSADGIVVAVVGIAAGRAQLDLTGDRVAEDATALAAYGIDTEELAALAGLYPVGTSLWRVPIEHFTTWDHNWPGVPAPGARDPNDPAPDLPGEPESCEVPGSIVQCENRTVAEELPILGTDLSLRYQSDRVPGARHTRRVRFLAIDDGPSGPPPNRIGVEASVEIAGRRISIAVPEPDDEGRAYAEYEWDGLDWRGRPTTRPERALIELCHVYPAQPASPEVAPTVTEVGTTSTFGRWGSFVRARDIDRSQRRATARLCKRGYTDRYFGTLDARLEHGLGGLMLTARDVPSPEGQSLHRGDGTIQRSADAYRIETLIRHNQVVPRRNINDVGATADNICMPVIEGHAIDPEGHLIFSIEEDVGCNGNGVWRLNRDRTLTRLVGTGTFGWFRPEHEGQRADVVPLHTPTDLAYGPDGSLFVADLRNARVFRVRPDGTRETVVAVVSIRAVRGGTRRMSRPEKGFGVRTYTSGRSRLT